MEHTDHIIEFINKHKKIIDDEIESMESLELSLEDMLTILTEGSVEYIACENQMIAIKDRQKTLNVLLKGFDYLLNARLGEVTC